MPSQRLLEQLLQGAAQLDAFGRITFANRTLAELTGHALPSLVGLHFEELLPVRERKRIALALASKDGAALETAIVQVSGVEVAVHLALAPVEDPEAHTGIIVTELRTDERFRLLADAMPQLVWSAFPNGSVDYYNSRHKEYAGLERQDDGRWNWTPVVHPDEVGPTIEAWTRASENGTRYEMEHRLLRADGRFAWHVSRAAPVRGPSGRIEKWFGTATDIDALKRAEQARKRSEDALRAADQRKDEFIAILAHELRNPLAPMRTAIEVLGRLDTHDPQAIAVRRMVERQMRHMSRLIDDLLDVSRVTRGKIELRKGPCDLREIVHEVVEDHRGVYAERHIALRLEWNGQPEPSLPMIGDRVRLAQVIGNLLHNSHKFTRPGGEVRVSVAREGNQAVLEIADTGIGIDAQLLERIFEPFSQADLGIERAQGGLGLGLSLVRGFVELHRGTVRASSPGVNRGATFTLTLPLELAQGPTTEPAEESPNSAAARLHILVIEDNVDAAETLEMLLSMLGHEVRLADSGPAGLDVARAWRPDLVLCDLGLPGMDGFEVAAALRAAEETRGAYLVAQSGYAAEEDRRRARQAGFDLHLTKPIEPARLRHVLSSVKPSWARRAEGAHRAQELQESIEHPGR